jgi:hypothetical protein
MYFAVSYTEYTRLLGTLLMKFYSCQYDGAASNH